MAGQSIRLTFVVPPEIEAKMKAIKRSRYADQTKSEMIRDLIVLGACAQETGNALPACEEKAAKKHFESPQVSILGHIGPKTNQEIVMMNNEQLETYLKENMPQKAEKRYQVSRDYICREIAGESVLVPVGDRAGNMMVTLNETSAFLWKQFELPVTAKDVILRTKQEYDDADGLLEQHVRDFINESVTTGYIWEVL